MKAAYHHGNLTAELLRAVEALVNEGGIDAVTMRAVTKAIGVSHTAPQHHYGDKTGLLTAFAAEGYRRLDATFTAASTSAPNVPPAERLLAIGTAYLHFAADQPAFFDVMFQPHLVDTSDADYAEASTAAYQHLHNTVLDLHRANHPRAADPDAFTTLAWAAVHGLAVLWRQGALARAAPFANPGDVADRVLPLLLDHPATRPSSRGARSSACP
ncbi:MAG: TetR/AcrR family transcriptional regulator [Gaiellales bacterium]